MGAYRTIAPILRWYPAAVNVQSVEGWKSQLSANAEDTLQREIQGLAVRRILLDGKSYLSD